MIKRRLWLSLIILSLLTACWDIKDLQTVNYITAIGLDYKQGKYIVYGQMMDFTSVAKQETGKPGTPPHMWVGKGTGETVNLAINELYNTAQQKSLWSHISAIIFTKEFLEQNLTVAADTLFRFREIRYTPWVYGTEESIEDIFTSPGFFNQTSLATILSEPIELYEQKSFIAPMKLVQLISEGREPDKTVLLPSIYVNRNQWKKNEKNESKLGVNGVFVLQNFSLQGWLSNSKLTGLRWMEPHTIRSPLTIKHEGKIKSVISLYNPKIDIEPIPGAGRDKPLFTVRIRLQGDLVENLDHLTEIEMEQDASKHIEKEIRETYAVGLENGEDLYSLQHVLYRKDYPRWKQLHDRQGFRLGKESLHSIQVEVKISDTGMIRLNKKETPQEK